MNFVKLIVYKLVMYKLNFNHNYLGSLFLIMFYEETSNLLMTGIVKHRSYRILINIIQLYD